MPVSDLTCASLCYAGYWRTHVFDLDHSIDAVRVLVKRLPDADLVVFPGSVTLTDWHRDFESVAMEHDAQLGPVGDGFIEGLRDVHQALLPVLGGSVIIAGHSLGAARALLFGALMCLDNRPPLDIVTFGSPRPGGQKLKDILSNVAIRSYRNGDDPVTCLPQALPGQDYMHPRDLIPLQCQSVFPDPWLSVGAHHFQYYLCALASSSC